MVPIIFAKKSNKKVEQIEMKNIMKIILIVIGIFILALIGIVVIFVLTHRGKNTDIIDGYHEKFRSEAPLEMKYSQLGSYETAYTEFASDNESIGKIRVWYPKELEKSDKTYPMIVAVNASGTPAAKYEPFFKRLSSWGFIVVGNEDPQTGTGETTSETLDFMLNLPADSVIFGRVDYENIGLVGYSQGGAGAICALTNYDTGKYYKTIFTGSAAYPLLAKNLGWEYDVSKIQVPYFMTAGTGKSDDSGTDPNSSFGGVSPLSALEENYNNIPDSVVKVRARAVGAEHEEMLARTDGYMTAWMLYQLYGDEEAGQAFWGEDAEILSNANWQDIEKNQ